MNLHEHKEEFEELIAIVADYIGVPADAVRRDYYIVQMINPYKTYIADSSSKRISCPLFLREQYLRTTSQNL